jgi:hypothetical protein
LACEARNDIHILADRYNGFISERDAEIKSVLIVICVDLSRHLEPVQSRSFARMQKTRQIIERISVEVYLKYRILYL